MMKCTLLKIGKVSSRTVYNDNHAIVNNKIKLSFFENNNVEYYINQFKLKDYFLDKNIEIDSIIDNNNKYSLKLDITLIKIPDVGESLSGLTNSGHFWYSTKTLYSIDNTIFITKNSIYVIYNLSEIRDSKIDKLLN